MSSSVIVRFYAAARAAAGAPEVAVPAGTLAEVLTNCTAGPTGKVLGQVLERCSFLVDGAAVHGEHGDILISAGSTLDVLPPFAGG